MSAAAASSSSSDLPLEISVIIAGPVDTGKSTLAHALCSEISKEQELREQRLLPRSQQQATWITDILNRLGGQQSRDCGMNLVVVQTAQPFRSLVSTAGQQEQQKMLTMTIVDTPGHRDFFKTACRGMALSPSGVMIFVVSAMPGEFEAHSCSAGDIRPLLTAAFVVGGIRRVVVAINKFEQVSSDEVERRYDEVCRYMAREMKRIGFNVSTDDAFVAASDSDVVFVKCSAFKRLGVHSPMTEQTATTEPSVVSALLHLTAQSESWLTEMKIKQQLPLRFVTRNCIVRWARQQQQQPPQQQVILVGAITQGLLKTGDRITVETSGICGVVAEIQSFGKPVESAVAGQHVGLRLSVLSSNSSNNLLSSLLHPSTSPRSVLARHHRCLNHSIVGPWSSSVRASPPGSVQSFIANVFFISWKGTTSRSTGFEPILFSSSFSAACRCEPLEPVLRKRVRCRFTVLQPKNTPLAMDVADSALDTRFSRFLLRDNKTIIGAGMLLGEVEFDLGSRKRWLQQRQVPFLIRFGKSSNGRLTELFQIWNVFTTVTLFL